MASFASVLLVVTLTVIVVSVARRLVKTCVVVQVSTLRDPEMNSLLTPRK